MDFYFKTQYKTALLIAGQLRLEDSQETSLSIYEKHTKQFAHDNLYLWLWKNELEKYPELEKQKYTKIISYPEDQPVLSEEEKELIPKAYQKTWDHYEHIKHNYIHRTVEECVGVIPSISKQFFQIGKFFEESLDDNDIFIKTRYDLLYRTQFDINKIKDLLLTKKPVVCVPFGGDTPKGRGIGDLFYVMNRSAALLMRDYLNVTLQYAKEGGPIHQESVFRYHLINKNNVDVYRFNFPLTRYAYQNLKMNDFFFNFNTPGIVLDKTPHIFEPQD